MDPKNTTAYLEYFGPWMVYDHITSKTEMDSFLKAYKIDKKKLKVSFSHFVRFVLKTNTKLDPHWQPQTDICQICNFNFDYLGKFETMRKDSKQIFDNINQQNVYKMFGKGDDTVYTKKTTTLLQKYYKQLSKDLLQKIYEHYKGDFEAFGYDPHLYIDY